MDFLSPERLFKELPLTQEEVGVLEEYICDYDFTVVGKQGPEWIFSLLSVVRAELGNGDMILEDYGLLNDIFIRILEWLLEGSDCLKCFEGVKLNDARMQVERYLDEAIAGREAVRLIDAGEEGVYVTSKLEKLMVSGYLYKKSLVWITLLTIVRFSPRLHLLPARGLVLLVYNTLNKPNPRVLDCFNERVALVREQDDALYFDGHTREQLQEAVWLLGARVLLGDPVQEELASLRSMFFRYLYLLSDKKEELARKNAFNSLLFNQKNAVFTWEELLKFSVPVLLESIGQKSVDVIRNCQGRLFEGHGQLLVETKAITLAAPVSLKFDTLMEIDGVALKLGYSKKKLSFEEGLVGTTLAWRGVFADFSDELRKSVIQKKQPPVGAVVNIRVKSVHDLKPTLVFVTVVDPRYGGQGVLHVSRVTRARLDSLKDIFHPGDVMAATVVESEDDRLQFSIWEELNQVAVEHLREGDQCNALLLSEKNGFLIWLSESGFLVSTPLAEGVSEEKGEYYLLEITDVPQVGRIRGKVLEATKERFDRHEAVANLVYSYIEACKDRNRDGQGTFSTGKIERSIGISGKYVKELTRLLQLYLTREVCLENLNLLYYIRLLAHVLGDSRLKGYYDCLINHLIVKYEFVEGRLGDLDLGALERDFRAYPALKSLWAVVKMLASYGDPSFADELERFSHSENEYVAKVAEAILAKNVQGNLLEESRWGEDELLELLSLKGEGEEDAMSGSMGGKRTFKNSLVYPVGAKHVDVEAQLDSIMQDICRFLNDQGGVVYIGMSDKGIPVGIQADLDYLCCNLDKYELFLHQRIKEAFGEEVDRTIQIERKQFGDKVVEALVVPRFDRVVEYHSEN